jgi:RNA polymerase sigma-70 factor (ECF subfamily)
VGEGRISAQEAQELAGCFTADSPGLFGYACTLTRGDRAQADDLVQAAFEAAGRSWPTLRGLTESQRRGWLRTTLTNIEVSAFRREKAFRDRMPRIESRYRVTPVDPAEQAISAVLLDRCWQIIRGLPERQHLVAMLRWQQDMKESEIAAALGMAENTVGTHLHRVRRKLLKQLGPGFPFLAGQEGEAP